MQLGVEGPLGRHRLRDVAHVENLTLCYKHFIGNYPVIMCQVCFRQKKTVCVCVYVCAYVRMSCPFRGTQQCVHPAFKSVCTCMHDVFVREFLWQSMKCLAGVTWGGRSSPSASRAKHWLWHSPQLKDSNGNQTLNETWSPWERCFYKFFYFVLLGCSCMPKWGAETQEQYTQRRNKDQWV